MSRLRHSVSPPLAKRSSAFCRSWADSFTLSTVWNGRATRNGATFLPSLYLPSQISSVKGRPLVYVYLFVPGVTGRLFGMKGGLPCLTIPIPTPQFKYPQNKPKSPVTISPHTRLYIQNEQKKEKLSRQTPPTRKRPGPPPPQRPTET